MARRGRAFEEGVYQFWRSIAPNAVVKFNHKVPDRDTGRLRQVDAWVEYMIGGHVRVGVLISCKDHARPLDVGEVESLMSEMRSTGASHGVLYSRAGFTEGALQKAKPNSVACCRLFENAPPEQPTELFITAYVVLPCHHISVEPLSDHAPADILWRDLLDTKETIAGQRVPLADVLFALCFRLMSKSELEPRPQRDERGPLDLMTHYDVAARAECPAVRVRVLLVWKWFRGLLNSFRLTGSVNFTDNNFLGTARVGPVSTDSPLPVDQWEECSPRPEPGQGVRMTWTFLGCPDADSLRAMLGPRSVFGSPPLVFEPPPASSLHNVLGKFGPPPRPPGWINSFEVTTHFGGATSSGTTIC